jgi:hypothetical protein
VAGERIASAGIEDRKRHGECVETGRRIFGLTPLPGDTVGHEEGEGTVVSFRLPRVEDGPDGGP